jgi:hypothetical protein
MGLVNRTRGFVPGATVSHRCTTRATGARTVNRSRRSAPSAHLNQPGRLTTIVTDTS